MSAQALRRILVDHARRHDVGKRAAARLPLDSGLDRLTEVYAEKARSVKLRYFASPSVKETAEAMGRSSATVRRECAVGNAWLYGTLNSEASSDPTAMA